MEEQQLLRWLLSCLNIADRVVSNWEHWNESVRNLLRSLRVQRHEIGSISRSRQEALELLRSKGLEDDYLRWLVGNITSDFAQAMHEAKELLAFLPQIQELADCLESPNLKNIAAAVAFYASEERVAHRERLRKMLEEANAARLPEVQLRRLALFLHTLLKHMKFPPHASDLKHALTLIAQRRVALNQLKELKPDLESFVKELEAVLRLLSQSVLSVVRMMLKMGEDAKSWLINYLEQPEEDVERLVPSQIDTEQLLVGVAQSRSLVEDMEHRLDRIPSYLKAVDQAALLLESPVLSTFSQTMVKRIDAWRRVRDRWVGLLNELERVLQQENG